MRHLRLVLIVFGIVAVAVLALWQRGDDARSRVFASGEMCTPVRPHASGTTVKTVTAGGLRSYRLHVPPSYTGSAPMPLVINMHGRGSSAFEQEFYSAFSTKSDAQGFVVAYPDGSLDQFGTTYFNAWQLPAPAADDVAFVNALLDAVTSQLCIDQSRVYSTGMSNGGMMSVRLACSVSHRIAAIAPVAGNYYPAMSNDLNPGETCPDVATIPVIAFHGTADSTVPYNGGPGSGATPLNYRLPQDDNTPADDVLSSWAARDSCTGSRQETQIDTEVRLIQYGGCANGALVQLYRVEPGGHTWPGAFDVPSLGYTTHQINATDLIWSFFSSYTLPDADSDLFPDGIDNCPADANFDQTNSDGAALDNGPMAPGNDVTIVNGGDGEGDVCDADDDNDGVADAAELTHPVAGCAPATAALDALDMDSDGDHLTDGWECAHGSDPANAASKFNGSPADDADGDRLFDVWEERGYNATGALADADGDGCHDLVEAASIDGNKTVGDADRLSVARRALNVWTANAAQDYVLDIDKNGVVGDPDRLFVARAALLPDWLPKSCV